MTASFEINAQKLTALNGGPHFKFTEAVSFVINCETQEEVGSYWNALPADRGEESQCGWLNDTFGLSSQVVSKALIETVQGPDQERAKRPLVAMMQMKKIEIRKLEEAYNQE